MLQAIGDILGNAVGAALSPLPIIALVLVLLSDRPHVSGTAYAVGWVLGLSGLGALVLVLDPARGGSATEPSTTMVVVRLVIGGLFFFFAFRQWQGRPRPGETPQQVGWMVALGTMPPLRVLGMGAALAVVNPKNLGLTIAAGVDIASHDLPAGQQAVTLAVFVLVASVTVIAPLAYTLIAGDRAKPLLRSLDAWLAAHGWSVMVVLFLVLGAKLVGTGLGGLG